MTIIIPEDKQVAVVYKTKDYSQFKIMTGNRVVNKAHLGKLTKSIDEESLIVPMIVNEKYEIIDGQTRFMAWMDLNLTVYYIIISGYGLNQVQRLNSNVQNWSIKNYTESYCALGNSEYKKYAIFKKTHGFGDYECIAMLEGNLGGSGSDYNRFRAGKFKIKCWSDANKKAKKIMQIRPYYKGYKRRSFILSMLHLLAHSDFDFDVLIKKLKFQSSKLVDCTNKNQYVQILEEIYNFKTKEKVSLKYLPMEDQGQSVYMS